ncbi:MAG: outer membrane beta-barrel protein [Terriglobales bacterium]
MHRKILLLAVVLVPLAVAVAGDEPRLEAFGGYSWLSTSLLQDTSFLPERTGLSGWNSSLTWNITHNLGFVTEASGFLGSPGEDNNAVRTRYNSFMVGPKITHHNHSDKVEVFVHQLFGFSHATLNSAAPRSLTANGFSLAAGFGMDFVVRKHLALRPVQVDYVMSQLAPHSQNQFRVSAGVILRWSFVDREAACPHPSNDCSPALR